MDSFEVNKILGGLLGTVFIIFSVGIASNSLFSTHAPEKPGFIIEAAEGDAGGAAAGGAAEATPIADLLAKADAKAGEAVFKKCAACHSIEKGGPNKVGPDLWSIVDRPVASHEGFSYSGAMKEFAGGGSEKWTFDNLNHFLTSPKGFVKGTAMGFAGLKKDDERANLIAYMREQADSPVPLPEAGAAEGTAPTETAPAEQAPAEAAPAEQAPAQEAPAAGEAAPEGEPAEQPAGQPAE
ncbi:cytochrome c family protein [Aquamicrobium sp. NLF2-7]|uniref:c-type cytochrome n=1 Tax=Aquamicrobium sp. NLF2-7 TaxID=2918753 RepID=UPI001EFB7AEF|nr:cytochrome c family protein [Aquamicrobium sp. NLF2-7]MCG8272464.1 cytochrome c family protein [Aquamicrobium sp. NLF2-7]